MWYESRKAQNQVVKKPHGEWYRKDGGVNERGWKEKREDVVQVSTSKAFQLPTSRTALRYQRLQSPTLGAGGRFGDKRTPPMAQQRPAGNWVRVCVISGSKNLMS